jgi:hypothetical protein
MQRLKRGLAIIVLLVVTDLAVGALGHVPVWNRVYRVLSGAPAVHGSGRLLTYAGVFPTDEGYLEPYTQSDEGIQLFKARGTPLLPPWIFVPRSKESSFRYKRPKPFGALG